MSVENSVWVRDPVRCWALGRVVRQVGTDLEVSLIDSSFPDDSSPPSSSSSAVIRVPLSETHPLDASHMGDSEDIAQMNNMHEGPLLALLDRRYHRDAIYTFTGDILISVNPYKGIPGLYDVPADEYKERKVPHVFSVAEISYRMMLEETNPSRKNQSMIVSGESGAGKTEACKHVMRYLATLSKRYVEKMAMAQSSSSSSSPRAFGSTISPDSLSSSSTPSTPSYSNDTSIEKKVLDCNPFLEAFGNAKTARNDNSSRFGKFLKIEYSGGRILGARIRHYLLEKARVVWPNEGERNYHIFYQLTRGATAEERVDLALGGVEDYRYLTSGGMPSTFIEGVDDAQEFADVRSALTNVGIGKPLQRSIFTVVAGLMHLGNVTFRDEGKDGSEAVIVNQDEADAAAKLLGCPRLPEKLVRRLISVKGRTSSYEVNLNSKQSTVARDSLAKTVYERLFSWLISRTNGILTSRQPATAFVGILDIFGFEIFELNSFEQLCINYANEKLQNLFNHHIFVMEMEQYKTEGVDVSSIAFVNNQLCVDLIEKKPSGLLPLLDEICFLGRETTDLEYLEKIEKSHGKGKHEFFGNPKKRHPSGDRFSVLHFAGEVTYCVKEFIEKNNDTLYTDLEKLMIGSDNTLIHDMFDDDAMAASEEALLYEQSLAGGGHEVVGSGSAADDAGHLSPAARKSIPSVSSKSKTQSVSTIASKFKLQLGLLNETLMSTTPHYVRCIKPNKVKKPHVFDHQMVLNQLLYAGVLETVKVRKQGFPFRETFVEFMRRVMSSGLAKVLSPSLVSSGKLVTPPNANFIEGEDGKAVDLSVTPELMSKCKEMCSLFLSAVLPSNGKLADDQVLLEKSAHAIGIAHRTRLAEKAAEANRRAVELAKAVQTASSPQAISSKGGAAALKAKTAAAHEAKELAASLNAMLAAASINDSKLASSSTSTSTSKKPHLSINSSAPSESPSSTMPQWTTGKLKIFMKDGALQGLVRRFRALRTLKLQAWWRYVYERRVYKIILRRMKKLQRGVRKFLMRKRYAKAERFVTVIQARCRGRRARARVAKLRKIRANAKLIVAASFLGRLHRLRYKRVRRAFLTIQLSFKFKRRMRQRALRKASATKMQAFYRMFSAMKRFLRIRYVRLNGASVIQAKWRSHRAFNNYRLLRRSVSVLQCRHRFKMRHRLRKKRARFAMRIAVAVKHWYKRLIKSGRSRASSKIAAWFKGISVRRKFIKSLRSAKKVSRQLRQKVERRALDRWTLDLHGAAAWGKVDEVAALLRCDNPTYARVKSNVPMTERALIRNRFDGLKSVLHTASQSGDTACFKLLLQFTPKDSTLAPIRDLLGQTPLHKAVAFGDASHGEIVHMLLEHRADVNALNFNGETPLDTAISAAMKASSVMARAGGHFSSSAAANASSRSVASHAKVISMLLSAGAVPSPSSMLTMNQIHALLSSSSSTFSMSSFVNANGLPSLSSQSSSSDGASIDNIGQNSSSSKWQISASDDPHYKLLCLAETERLKRKAASAARALLVASNSESDSTSTAGSLLQASLQQQQQQVLSTVSVLGGGESVLHVAKEDQVFITNPSETSLSTSDLDYLGLRLSTSPTTASAMSSTGKMKKSSKLNDLPSPPPSLYDMESTTLSSTLYFPTSASSSSSSSSPSTMTHRLSSLTPLKQSNGAGQPQSQPSMSTLSSRSSASGRKDLVRTSVNNSSSSNNSTHDYSESNRQSHCSPSQPSHLQQQELLKQSLAREKEVRKMEEARQKEEAALKLSISSIKAYGRSKGPMPEPWVATSITNLSSVQPLSQDSYTSQLNHHQQQHTKSLSQSQTKATLSASSSSTSLSSASSSSSSSSLSTLSLAMMNREKSGSRVGGGGNGAALFEEALSLSPRNPSSSSSSSLNKMSTRQQLLPQHEPLSGNNIIGDNRKGSHRDAAAASFSSAPSSLSSVPANAVSQKRDFSFSAIPTAPPPPPLTSILSMPPSTASKKPISAISASTLRQTPPKPRSQNPPVPISKPAPRWTLRQSSSTGLCYYSNAETGKTQWTEPEDWDNEYDEGSLGMLLEVQQGQFARIAKIAQEKENAKKSLEAFERAAISAAAENRSLHPPPVR